MLTNRAAMLGELGASSTVLARQKNKLLARRRSGPNFDTHPFIECHPHRPQWAESLSALARVCAALQRHELDPIHSTNVVPNHVVEQ